VSDDRHARGLVVLEELLGADAAAPILAAADLSPDLVRFAVDFAFGEVLSRPGLDLRTQELCTIAALAAESARLHRYARDRLQVAEENFSEALDAPVPPNIAQYRIVADDVLNKVSLADFVGTGIKPSADSLNAMIKILASALESAGIANKLTGGALIGHLKNVIQAAEVLKQHLEKWEIDNPIQGYRTA